MPLTFLFPGQSSADPMMVRRAASLHAAAREVVDRARSMLGADALEPYVNEASARLQSNRDVQISVFLTTQMHLAALRAEGIEAARSLGLSLGEYTHLVHIGALGFEDALALVAARGAAYDQSRPGIMITVIGPESAEVEKAVAAEPGGEVFVSNYNTPTQHVIAGAREAVERVAARLENEGGARTIEIESRVPMHTPMLDEVAARFKSCLESAPWREPKASYRANVTGRSNPAPTPGLFVERLTRHVTHPVRWRESIEAVAAEDPRAVFVEVGPGEVLHNMLSRRWMRVERARTDDPFGSDPRGSFRATVEALRDRA